MHTHNTTSRQCKTVTEIQCCWYWKACVVLSAKGTSRKTICLISIFLQIMQCLRGPATVILGLYACKVTCKREFSVWQMLASISQCIHVLWKLFNMKVNKEPKSYRAVTVFGKDKHLWRILLWKENCARAKAAKIFAWFFPLNSRSNVENLVTL